MSTHRLLISPGTPEAREIQLKPGGNSLGRGEENDVVIADPSVSTRHCRIVVENGSVSLEDLGSTNGSFINHAPVQQGPLQAGCAIRLGNVELLFQSDAAGHASEATATPPKAAPLRITLTGPPASVAEPLVATATGEPAARGPVGIEAASRFCKFHPKWNALHWCPKCERSFCDLCVTSRSVGSATTKACRSCGVDCLPLQVQQFAAADEGGGQGFFKSLPGAFAYPFRGTGVLVLIVATILFAALAFLSGGWVGILMKMVALGYLFTYMQAIIFATAAEEKNMPELPAMDGLFSAFFTLVGTVLMSFGVAIALAVARFWSGVDSIPTAAILAAVIFGCLYFPMAFLATAMKDTALASNPLIVVPSILKVPLEYLVAVVLMAGIFGLQKLGDVVTAAASSDVLRTTSMSVMFMGFGLKIAWNFMSVYLLTVNMRILGLLYLKKKDALEWF